MHFKASQIGCIYGWNAPNSVSVGGGALSKTPKGERSELPEVPIAVKRGGERVRRNTNVGEMKKGGIIGIGDT